MDTLPTPTIKDNAVVVEQSTTNPVETSLSFVDSLKLNGYYVWCGIRDASQWTRSFAIITG
jgi:hypothetical protein